MDSAIPISQSRPPSPTRTHAQGFRYWLDRARAFRILVLALIDGPRLFDRLPTTAWYAEMSNQLFQAIGPGPSDCLLDLGCGSGRHAISASHAVDRVVAADRSSRMLEVAQRNRIRSRATNIDIQQEDAEALSFEDESFDLATGFMLLPVFNDPTTVLQELLRVVRPGGRIGLLVPSETLTPPNAWGVAMSRGLLGIDRDSLLAWAHTSRRYTREDLHRLPGLSAAVELQILPLLDDLAYAAILTKSGRCVLT